MLSKDSNGPQGCSGWLKWLVGTVIAFMAAAGGLVALLEYLNPSEHAEASSNPIVEVHVSSLDETGQEPVSANTSTSVSPEEWQAVEDFLNLAVISEIAAYEYGDPAYATVFYGDALQAIRDRIADLNSRGILLEAHFDYENSYIYDIRLTQNDRIEVDSCEYWSNDYYDRQTSVLLGSDSWALVPQTIMIDYLNSDYYITSVAFYTGQAFCY